MFVMKKPAGVYSNLWKKIPMASFCAKEYLIVINNAYLSA